MQATSRLPIVVIMLAASFALAGCSFSANPTVPADDIATLAEDTLEEQIGQRPEIDCGDEAIGLVEGDEVDCLLTDPTTGSEFDTTIVFTSVEGSDYTIDIQVAEQPN